jgi:hypothetical protein
MDNPHPGARVSDLCGYCSDSAPAVRSGACDACHWHLALLEQDDPEAWRIEMEGPTRAEVGE